MPPFQNSLLTEHPKHLHKWPRRPLQPKNCFPATENILKIDARLTLKSEISLAGESNKENLPVAGAQPFDASLAEELSEIRKKNERLRLDRERTEVVLKEKDRVMDLRMEEIRNRGEFQKMFEIEVDRLFRLKELHSSSTRISPIRSLREKESEKRNNNGFVVSPLKIDQELRTEDLEESEGENTLKSSDSDSSEQIVEEKPN